VATDKVTTDKAAAKKVDVDKAAATKATEEAMAKAAVDVDVMKTAGQGGAATQTTAGSVGSGSGSSPGPAVGSKRVAAVGGTTPPFKRFRGAWKSRYVEQLCSRHLPFILFVLYLIEFFVD
jgi:membrane protein involved in colicin uptake